MNKQEFLGRLKEALAGLPQEDIEERLDFYSEMIDDRIEEGLTESEAVAEIGSVEDVARQIMAEIPLAAIVREKVKPKRALRAWEIVLLVLGSPIWLSLMIAVFAVVLSLFIVLWSVVLCFWVTAIALAAGIVWCLFQVFVYQQSGNLGGAAFAGGGAILCAGLSIALFLASLAITKAGGTLTKKMILWIKSWFVGKEAA